MVRVALDDFVSITTVRANWSGRSFCEGSSRWNFMMPRAAGDVRALIGNKWLDFLGPLFIYGRPNSWRLDTVEVIDAWPGDLAALVLDVRLDADPPGEGPGLPPQVSPIISWRTGAIGRANRGRTYMGQYCLDSCEDTNVVGPGQYATDHFAQEMMNHFGTDVDVDEPRFVIVSHQEDNEPITPGAYSPVTDFVLFDRFATVRARNTFRFTS